MKINRFLSILLAVIMTAGAFPMHALAEEDVTEGVEYLFYDVNAGKFETMHCTEYTPLDPSVTAWTDGWYVAEGYLELGDGNGKAVTVRGDVHLILKDGCYLKVLGGVNLVSGNTLTIYAQQEDSGLIDIYAADNFAGIGGGSFEDCGDLFVHGGRIFAYGGETAAGIGGGWGGSGGNVTVYGGNVRGFGGDSGAGIGSGYMASIYTMLDAGSLTQYAGKVAGIGGNNAAGIGGGAYGDGGDVAMYGGVLSGEGRGGGSGIGGGDNKAGGTVAVYGGTVTATSHDGAAAIGGGCNGAGGSFCLYGGTVIAESHFRADQSAADCHAIGAGIGAWGTGTIEYADGLIFIDEETGRPYENGFSMNPREVMRRYSVSISAVRSEEYPVTYREYSSDGTYEDKECADYVYLYNSVPVWDTGWYVMDSTGTMPNNISVTGNANLILTNGSDLTVNGSIIINDGCSLTVYAQPLSEDGETSGKLTVNGARQWAAIGGSGDVTFHGGTVEAFGGTYGAGIGGLYNGEDAINVTVYAGDITACGGTDSAGIGGSYQGNGCFLHLYGGSITAKGGPSYSGTSYYRAIGSGCRRTDNGYIRLGTGLILTDNVTGEEIRGGFYDADWTELLDGTELSFSVVPPTQREPVSYRVFDEDLNTFRTESVSAYSIVNSLTTVLTDGWYVLDETGTIDNILSINGDAHLILKDGCTLTVTDAAVKIPEGNSLTVYAQSNGENMGSFIGDSSGNRFGAGIGSGSGVNAGSFTVHGGNITGIGGENGAGIGSGSYDMRTGAGARGLDLVVYGGNITAVGGVYGAGIGGGALGSGGSVRIYGGTITAKGGSESCAGIGAGMNGTQQGEFSILNTGSVKAGPDQYHLSEVSEEEYGLQRDTYVTISIHEHRFTGRYTDNGNGSHSRKCAFCDEYSHAEPHSYYNGVCGCGAVRSAKVFEFDTISLVLSGELGLNFYCKVYDVKAAADGFMLFEIGNLGETQKVWFRDLEMEPDGRYIFRCNVNSLQMADDITVSFRYGEETVGPRHTSVAEYIEKVIENHGGADTDPAVVLAESIINYGHYAQLALQETHGFTLGEAAAGADYSRTDAYGTVAAASPEQLAPYQAVKTGESEKVTKISRSISLEHRTDINLYLTVTEGHEPSVCVTDCFGSALAPDPVLQSDGRYLASIPDIAAHMLGDTYRVTIDEEITMDVSALSYVYSILTSDRSEAQKLAVSALYEYYLATLAYRNAE